MKPIYTLNLDFHREFFTLAETVAYVKRIVKDKYFKLGTDTRFYTDDELNRLADRLAWVKTLTIYKANN